MALLCIVLGIILFVYNTLFFKVVHIEDIIRRFAEKYMGLVSILVGSLVMLVIFSDFREKLEILKELHKIRRTKMRFTIKNWDKFFDGSNKQTTIRLRMNKLGHHKAYAGSYFKPKLLGEFDIVRIERREYGKLHVFDAIEEGFQTLQELKQELEKLNGPIKQEQLVYKHFVENVRRR